MFTSFHMVHSQIKNCKYYLELLMYYRYTEAAVGGSGYGLTEITHVNVHYISGKSYIFCTLTYYRLRAKKGYPWGPRLPLKMTSFSQLKSD